MTVSVNTKLDRSMPVVLNLIGGAEPFVTLHNIDILFIINERCMIAIKLR